MLHMYWSKSFFSIFAFFCLLIVTNLDGHGFGAGTLIKTSEDSWCVIEQVCLAFCRNKEHVVSYDLQKQRSIPQRIKSVGQSKTNCYYKISFDDNHYNDLICTPTQEFYISSTQQWIPAYTLQVGDLLLCQNNKVACVTHIEFIKQPIKIYTLEIKKTHNFFVGAYAVLTHNMVLPLAFSAGLSIPFGSITCGAIGSFLGPVGVTVGIGLGTIIGLAVKAVFEDRIPTYTVPVYDDTFFDQYIRTINHFNEGIDGTSQSFTVVASGTQLDEAKNVLNFSLEKNKSIKQLSNQSQSYNINPQSPKKPKKDYEDKDSEHPNGIYKGAKYHHKNSNGLKNPAPKNGQAALDKSVQYNEKSPHRVGTSEGEIVILSQTAPGEFHGHVRTWKQLLSEAEASEAIRNALRNNGFVNSKGKILK